MKRLVLIACLLASPVFALQPDEVLPDPGQELRARELSKELRCLVCRNESIDESDAAVARDLRLLVRERILAGDSDDEVLAFIEHRFGEYVLLKPRLDGANFVLWAAGPLMLLIALGSGLIYLRRRSQGHRQPLEALSDAEKRRLEEILKN